MNRYIAFPKKMRSIYPETWPSGFESFAQCVSPQAYFEPLIAASERLLQCPSLSLSPVFFSRILSSVSELPKHGRYLVLFRHGVSEYNAVSRFTGWHDPSLSAQGVLQAKAGWTLLSQLDPPVLNIFESPQQRALMTTNEALNLGISVVIETSPFLLERHYGDKQGQSVNVLESAYGLDAFIKMRWSYSDRPGNMENPGESLADVERRLRPYLYSRVLPKLMAGSVCVVGQGNCMRTLCKILEGLTPDAVENLECLSSEIIFYHVSEDVSQVLAKYILKNPAVPDPMCLSPKDYREMRLRLASV